MPKMPPSDPSKPPLSRRPSTTNVTSEPGKMQAEPPILAARPSLAKAPVIRRTAQNGGDRDSTTTQQDIDERIRQRAYELWEQRGCLDGFQEEDWQRAEAELREQLQHAS